MTSPLKREVVNDKLLMVSVNPGKRMKQEIKFVMMTSRKLGKMLVMTGVQSMIFTSIVV